MHTYKKAIREKDLVLSAELPLRPDMSAADVVRSATPLAANVDGILLTDNQYGQTHMSQIAAASLLLGAHFDPIVQLCCRNRNRIALISELLGMQALGVTSIMLIRGNKVPDGIVPRPKSVMDMQARQLIATAQTIKDDDHLGGDDFLVVASGTVHEPPPGWVAQELHAKGSAGAQVIITQLCFDVCLMKRYMAVLVAQKVVRELNVVVSLATLPSAEVATWLRDNRRRALIPDDVIERLAQAVDPEIEGVAICSEVMQQYAEIPGISGINLMTPGSLDTLVAAVSTSGLRAD